MGMGFIELTYFLQNDRENLLPSIFDHKETSNYETQFCKRMGMAQAKRPKWIQMTTFGFTAIL